MKTIGLIGGMSWESSAEYYKIINEEVKKRLGGFNSAKTIMYSVNFAEIEKLQEKGNWEKASEILINSAISLEKAGVDCILLCTNTMHIVADKIEKAVKVPFLHIADSTGKVIEKQNIKKIGLLGTKFTMQKEFYKGRLISKFGLDVVVPNLDDQEIVHNIIYTELCLGSVKPESKKEYLKIIERMKNDGVEGVILGCTEIGLLIKREDVDIPIFDTTIIHAIEAVDFALNK